MISARLVVTLVAFLLASVGSFAVTPKVQSKSSSAPAFGDRGPQVMEAQKRLQSKGFLKKGIKAYGYCGPLTVAALKLEASSKASAPQKAPIAKATPSPKGFEMHASTAHLPVHKTKVVHGAVWSFFFGTSQTSRVSINAGMHKLYSAVGRATQFGGHDKYDNGVGHNLFNPNSVLEGLRTTHIKGVALRRDLLCKVFNLPPVIKKPTRSQLVAEWNAWECVRKAGVKVCAPGHKPEIVHIVDFLGNGGPAAIDETWHLNRDQGGDGMHSFEILDNCFPSGHAPEVIRDLKALHSRVRMASR